MDNCTKEYTHLTHTQNSPSNNHIYIIKEMFVENKKYTLNKGSKMWMGYGNY